MESKQRTLQYSLEYKNLNYSFLIGLFQIFEKIILLMIFTTFQFNREPLLYFTVIFFTSVNLRTIRNYYRITNYFYCENTLIVRTSSDKS